MTNHIGTASQVLLMAASPTAAGGAARRRRRRRTGLIAAGLRGLLTVITNTARDVSGVFGGGMGGAAA